MSSQPEDVFVFHDRHSKVRYELRYTERRPLLLRNGTLIQDVTDDLGFTKDDYQSQVLRVLACLLRRPGLITEEKTFLKEAWQDENVRKGAGAIHQYVTRIRRLLNDDPKDPKFIETVPKAGYKFLVEVEINGKRTFHSPAPKGELDLKFRDFFGCSPTDAHKGQVILQHDAIESILAQLDELKSIEQERREKGLTDLGPVHEGRYDPLAHLRTVRILPPSRMFKARCIINKWDTDSAKAICDKLRDQGFGSPQIDLRARRSPGQGRQPMSAPFEISMGLGFSDRTNSSVLGCSDWMQNHTWWDCGDALSLHELLIPADAENYLEFDLPGKMAGNFRRLLPRGWSETSDGRPPGLRYMEKWCREDDDVEDYAIIFRHADSEGVRLVCAGFTEKGTCAAGHYLAQNWDDSLSKLVDPIGIRKSVSEGDFLVVICGRSNDPGKWDEVRSMRITPTTLRQKGWKQRPNGDWYRARDEGDSKH